MPSTFPQRLRRARGARGLAAAELARKARLARQHIALLEARPGTNVTWSTVQKLALALDVDARWLASGEGKGPSLPKGREKRAAVGDGPKGHVLRMPKKRARRAA